jgi:virulence-associated protein VagC
VIRTTLFLSNRSQAVRLPKDVGFPERVREVRILREGKKRVIALPIPYGTISLMRRASICRSAKSQTCSCAKNSDAALRARHQSVHPRAAQPPSDIARAFHQGSRVLPFDGDAAGHAADIRAPLERRGQSIGAYDVLIAGYARSRGLIVVTGNLDEFARVDGLRREDWLA